MKSCGLIVTQNKIIMGRNYQRVVRFTKEENEKISKRAEEKNMTVAEYLRVIGLNSVIDIKTR